jgi:hypothetical protein
MIEYLDNLDFRHQYAVRYKLEDRWRSLPLDLKTAKYFKDQLKREGFLDQQREKKFIFMEDDYDFFLSVLKRLRVLLLNN